MKMKACNATILLMDVTASMGDAVDLNGNTHLQLCSDIIQLIIKKKLFEESNDLFALLLMGTDDSDNHLSQKFSSETNAYNHISLVRTLAPISWTFLNYITTELKTYNNEVDMLNALIVGADIMRDAKENYNLLQRKIIVLSAFQSPKFEMPEAVLKGIQNDKILIDFITPYTLSNDPMLSLKKEDYDDDDENDHDGSKRRKNDYDNRYKPMDGLKYPNGELLTRLDVTISSIARYEGELYSYSQSLDMLSTLTPRMTSPMGQKFVLEISDQITIPLQFYLKVKENKPDVLKGKKVLTRDPNEKVVVERSRFTKDDEGMEVEASDLIDGYMYGKSFIPISEADAVHLKLDNVKSLKLVVFTTSDRIRTEYIQSAGVYQVMPQLGDDNAMLSVTALCKAMIESNNVAIVRKVFSKRSDPEIGYLTPIHENQQYYFIYHKLPYAEDMRKYDFPLLAIEDKEIEHFFHDDRKLKDEEIGHMNNFIDHSMLLNDMDKWKNLFQKKEDEDLTIMKSNDDDIEEIVESDDKILKSIQENFARNCGDDIFKKVLKRIQLNLFNYKSDNLLEIDDFEDEILAPEDTYNPQCQRMMNEICERVLNKEHELPLEKFDDIAKNGIYRSNLTDKYYPLILCQELLGRELQRTFELPKILIDDITTTNDTTDFNETTEQSTDSNDDVEERFQNTMNTLNPIIDFENMMVSGETFKNAFFQLAKTVKGFLTNVFNRDLFNKSLECLQFLRKQCIEKKSPNLFNEFLRSLKSNVFDPQTYGTDDFENLLVENDVQLINDTEVENDGVKKEEAIIFIKKEIIEEKKEEIKNDDDGDLDADDLLDFM
ncbi:hypothetical protein SNEBB_000920 [Seison nebaliae]|nr:hypothetical protein SNEBB_000920 [Seison nebaliae]